MKSRGTFTLTQCKSHKLCGSAANWGHLGVVSICRWHWIYMFRTSDELSRLANGLGDSQTAPDTGAGPRTSGMFTGLSNVTNYGIPREQR